MKMAKASNEEIQAAIDFNANLEGLIEYGLLTDAPEDTEPDFSDRAIADLVRSYFEEWGGLTRIVFGYSILVRNVCDPDADTLEWRKELVDAASKIKSPEESTV